MGDRGGNHHDVGVAVDEVEEGSSAADHRGYDLAREVRVFRAGKRTRCLQPDQAVADHAAVDTQVAMVRQFCAHDIGKCS